MRSIAPRCFPLPLTYSPEATARFNKDYNYPYTFLNDEPFTDEFKAETSALASGPCEYGLIPSEEWGDIPEWINTTRMDEVIAEMGKNTMIPYGGSLSYRYERVSSTPLTVWLLMLRAPAQADVSLRKRIFLEASVDE